MNTRIAMVFFLIVSISCALPAEPSTVSLGELMDMARKDNAGLRSIREKTESYRLKIAAESTPENPEIFAEYQNMPSGPFNFGSASEKMYGIQQMLPFPYKLLLRRRMAAADYDGMKWEYRAAEASVMSRLKSAYAGYWYAKKSVDIYEESAGLIDGFVKAAQAKYAAGKADQTEVLKMRIEATKMLDMKTEAQGELEMSKSEINMLVGRDADSQLGEPEYAIPRFPEISWDAVKKAVIKNNPDLLARAAGTRAGDLSRKYAGSGFLPDFDIKYVRRKMADGSGHDFMLGLTVPVWAWGRASEYRSAASAARSAQADEKDAVFSAVADARKYFVTMQTLRKRAQFYENDILPAAEQAFKGSGAMYRSDTGDFFTLIDSFRTLLGLRLEYFKAVSEYGSTAAKLESVTGTGLEGLEEK
jgi:outer membrane protein TolC